MPDPGDKGFWESDEVYVALPTGVLAPGLQEYATQQRLGGCCLFQTSGSEGEPKWVVLTKSGMLTSARAVCAHLAVTAADRWLLALPQWHVGGFSLWSRAFVSGSNVVDVSAEKWSAQSFAEAVAAHRITLSSLVPTQVVDLVREERPAPKWIRAIVVGGGRLEPEIGQRARDLGWPVLQSYGMTEAGSQIATEPLDHLGAHYDPDTLEVLPHWKTSLRDGRLVISGPALAAGYIKPSGSNDWAWEPIGDELITRDQVELRQANNRTTLRFVSREAHMLKILGELAHLGTLQAKLSAICIQDGHATSTAVLVAEPDTRRGHNLILRYNQHALSTSAAEHLLTTFNTTVRPFERIQSLHPINGPVLNEMGKVRRM